MAEPNDRTGGRSGGRSGDIASGWLDRIWAALDGDPGLTERVRITGSPGLLPAVYDVGALATASVAAATLAVAELGARRLWTAVPGVGVDRFAAAAAFRSEALLGSVGWELPPVWDPIAGDYQAADGWIRLHTNYAAHRAAALRALGIEDDEQVDREQVALRVRRFAAQDLEQQVVSAGGCAAALHTVEDWAAHPHGTVAGGQPGIWLERRSARAGHARLEPGAGREPGTGWAAADGGPLAGIRVLDLTRVIAGPVCTRTLAAWGAEVLRIDPPGFAEVPALLPETTVGKHCAAIDLRSEEGRSRFAELVGAADVLVHGLRPGALAGLGFSERALRRLNPGLCIAALDAYGWAGPWKGRRGFDSLVQFSCGIAAAGGAAVGSDRPVPLPAQALDHATGYLLAAAVCRGLTGRYDGLPPAGIRGALIGTANLLMEQPVSLSEAVASTPLPGSRSGPGPEPGRGPEPVPAPAPESGPGSGSGPEPGPGPGPESGPLVRTDLASMTVIRETAWGLVSAVPQPGTIAGTQGSWRVPAGPLGRHPPIFPSTGLNRA
jgi:hypothetical protein